MAKKQTKNLSIEEREKNLRESNIGMAIIGGIAIFLISWGYFAYDRDFPRAGMAAKLSGGVTYLTGFKKLFPFPGANFGLILSLVLIYELIIMAWYFKDKIKLHGNLNTLKGSSVWENAKEITKRYAELLEGSAQKAANNAIMSKNVYVSLNAQKHFKALNTLILGTTGSGKSRYFLKPNLLQMNSSYVVTDPKGEILASCGEMLRRNGYRVRVFDILNMGNCNTYNPLKYCEKESDVKKIAQAFIKNTDSSGGKGGGNKDPFWDDSMNAFLCAMISFLCQCPEGSDTPYAQIKEITGGTCYKPVFANICDLTRMANKKWTKDSGIELMKGVQLGDGKNNTAGASELSAIFENLRLWEAKRQGVEVDMILKPYCLREWENFKIAPEKTSTTILMTVAVRLDPFNIEQVRQLTSSDDLNLQDFGTQRDALFLIIPPTDRTYNFLVAFLYTQLFDILYKTGAEGSIGSKILKLPNGELVKYFPKEEVDAGIDDAVAAIKNAKAEKQQGQTFDYEQGSGKKAKTKKFDDSWYDIISKDGRLISRRPDKASADKYLADLKKAKLTNGKNPKLPYHVRFLMDEFANIGELPEFKDKLATVRGYEISITVICQSITQLKGMYPDDYEVVDANCPFTIFLGGDENTNNEYLSKKIGKETVKGDNTSMDNKDKANRSYNYEERDLIKPEELGRIPYNEQIVLIYGEQPIRDEKVDYPALPNYWQTNDFAGDLGHPDANMFHRPDSATVKQVLTYKPIQPSAQAHAFVFDKDVFLSYTKAVPMQQAVKDAVPEQYAKPEAKRSFKPKMGRQGFDTYREGERFSPDASQATVF